MQSWIPRLSASRSTPNACPTCAGPVGGSTGRLLAALRASESRFRAAFADAGIGMALIDADDLIIEVNPAFAAMLGREPGESVEDYRARVVPFVQTALAVPRTRLADARKAAEAAASVTDEQRAKLDALFQDVQEETLELTNQAILDGDLTPYERNYGGVLQWGGGLGAILNSTQARIGDILTPEQRAIMADQGFEWGEYLGVTMPWEELQPPPAPSDG